MKKDLNLTGLMQEAAEDIKRWLDQLANDIDNSVKYQLSNRNSHVKPAEIVPADESAEQNANSTVQNNPSDSVKEEIPPKTDNINE